MKPTESFRFASSSSRARSARGRRCHGRKITSTISNSKGSRPPNQCIRPSRSASCAEFMDRNLLEEVTHREEVGDGDGNTHDKAFLLPLDIVIGFSPKVIGHAYDDSNRTYSHKRQALEAVGVSSAAVKLFVARDN
jgi:hypothetical protein